eukprot:CAMPEP_0202979596 /NCGR_PEP_ID=MMETSP1396-20130829/85700_1 /ASSEMBLY_ACC=CAM_ASM_000872 /TAXON_ID= /ORGANISM="Pseudokeronopsis sp., Strain Brazil" /LENGTH=75 /DNA_ID=CAMNT_0049719083 /DNA_START=965 /DNA_END=1192 /DNA_ORIENTATION=-
MAACHGVTRLGDEFIGDPLEVKMFEAAGWELIESEAELGPGEDFNGLAQVKRGDAFDGKKYKLSILRRFDFSSKL